MEQKKGRPKPVSKPRLTCSHLYRDKKAAELPTQRLAQMLAEQKATVGTASTARRDCGPMPWRDRAPDPPRPAEPRDQNSRRQLKAAGMAQMWAWALMPSLAALVQHSPLDRPVELSVSEETIASFEANVRSIEEGTAKSAIHRTCCLQVASAYDVSQKLDDLAVLAGFVTE
jgi:hypothetical protein